MLDEATQKRRDPKPGKRVKLLQLLEILQEYQAPQPYIYVEDLDYILTSAMISGSRHESESMALAHNGVVPLTSLVVLFLPPYFPQENTIASCC